MFEVMVHVEMFSNKAGHRNHRNNLGLLGQFESYNEALSACYEDANNWTSYPNEVEWSMRKGELVGFHPDMPQSEVHYDIIKI